MKHVRIRTLEILHFAHYNDDHRLGTYAGSFSVRLKVRQLGFMEDKVFSVLPDQTTTIRTPAVKKVNRLNSWCGPAKRTYTLQQTSGENKAGNNQAGTSL